MPYYNVNRGAKNIRALKNRQGARKVKKKPMTGKSKPYSDMSGNMTSVRKSNPEKRRFRIRYDKM